MLLSVVLIIAVLLALGYALIWRWAPTVNEKRLHAACSTSQSIAGLITAVGIVVAGLLYALEQQWSPRFAVDITAEVHAARDQRHPAALLQTTITITNLGRTSQTLSSWEIGAASIGASETSKPDQFGDLPSVPIHAFASERFKVIGAGETDRAYGELLIPCAWKLVRVIVKVPRPPFSIKTPPEKRLVYQRKLLVSTEKACSHEPTAERVPQAADPKA